MAEATPAMQESKKFKKKSKKNTRAGGTEKEMGYELKIPV